MPAKFLPDPDCKANTPVLPHPALCYNMLWVMFPSFEGFLHEECSCKPPVLVDTYTVPDKSLVAWVQIELKCPSNIFLINVFLQEMAHFNPNSFWNNVLVKNETVEKYSNVHSLVKPIESIFAKTKVLSPCHMMDPILD